MRKISTLILIAFYCCSCRNNPVVIEPVDAEFNQRLLSGNGLDPNLFSREVIAQYYEIDNYEELSPQGLKTELEGYVTENFTVNEIAKFKEMNFIFYRKGLFKDHSKNLYRLVQESDSGFIDDYKDDFAGAVSFIKVKGSRNKLLQDITVYNIESDPFSHPDTLTVDQY
jgi:hypothetical protein